MPKSLSKSRSWYKVYSEWARQKEAIVAYGLAHPGHYERQDDLFGMEEWEGVPTPYIEWHRRDAANWRARAAKIEERWKRRYGYQPQNA